jgi:predicted nucleic acid-binding protein
LSVYLDANVIVALFSDDMFTARAINILEAQSPILLISDFAAAEFASAVNRRVRMGEMTAKQGQQSLENFDFWAGKASTRVPMDETDIRFAEQLLRRLQMNLRTPDAIHIAIAQRIGAELATFDTRMAENAKALGVALAPV